MYARKSTEDKHKQIQSIDDQLSEVMPIIEENKDTLIGRPYTEAKSAKKAGKRVEFNKMIARINRGGIEGIYCWDTSRLARNMTEGGVLIDMVSEGVIKIITPTHTFIDTPDDVRSLANSFSDNQKKIKDLKIDVTRGLESKIRKGFAPLIAPVGYKNIFWLERGEKYIDKDPEKFDLVRKWWEMILSGQYTVDESLSKITAMGLTSRKGKPVSRTTAYYTFRNPFYTGSFLYKEVVHQGKHTPMVTWEEFDRVQDIIGGKKYRKEDTDPLPYKGFVRCKECGHIITGEKHVKKYKKSGKEQTFYYYRCSKGQKDKLCTQPYMKADEFNKQVGEYLSSLEVDPKLIDWVRGVLKRQNAEEFGHDRKQKELQTKRLIDISERKEFLFKMKIEGLYSDEDFEQKKQVLLKEEEEIKSMSQRGRLDYWEGVINDSLTFVTALKQKFYNANPATKRMILQALSSNLFFENKKLELDAKTAFILLKQTEKTISDENIALEPQNSAINRDNVEVSKNVVTPSGFEPELTG